MAGMIEIAGDIILVIIVIALFAAIEAFVAMPDHVHLLLTPAHEISLEKAMQYIKGGFSFRRKSKLPVWEASFMEHRITDASDYERHVGYIEANPVRAGFVEEAARVPFSSASLTEAVDPAPGHLRRESRAKAPLFGPTGSQG
jgi:putative transposase